MKSTDKLVNDLINGKRVRVIASQSLSFTDNENFDHIRLSYKDLLNVLPIYGTYSFLAADNIFDIFVVKTEKNSGHRLVVQLVNTKRVTSWSNWLPFDTAPFDWLSDILNNNGFFKSLEIINPNYSKIWKSCK